MKSVWKTLDAAQPRIIAHRGASGYRPEHTIEAYRLAIELGADVIEPDLHLSKDQVLLARHDRGLARSTTWVSSKTETKPTQTEYADQNIDELTWVQLNELCAIQAFKSRSREWDGRFRLTKFESILALARTASNSTKKIVVYPEIKHPKQLLASGFDITAQFCNMMHRLNILGDDASVWAQSFDLDALLQIKKQTALPCFLLLDGARPTGLDQVEIATVDGIAVHKSWLLDSAGVEFVAACHKRNWQVHAWTFRDDDVDARFTSPLAELCAAIQTGVDALFCDFPDRGLAARTLCAKRDF